MKKMLLIITMLISTVLFSACSKNNKEESSAGSTSNSESYQEKTVSYSLSEIITRDADGAEVWYSTVSGDDLRYDTRIDMIYYINHKDYKIYQSPVTVPEMSLDLEDISKMSDQEELNMIFKDEYKNTLVSSGSSSIEIDRDSSGTKTAIESLVIGDIFKSKFPFAFNAGSQSVSIINSQFTALYDYIHDRYLVKKDVPGENYRITLDTPDLVTRNKENEYMDNKDLRLVAYFLKKWEIN